MADHCKCGATWRHEKTAVCLAPGGTCTWLDKKARACGKPAAVTHLGQDLCAVHGREHLNGGRR